MKTSVIETSRSISLSQAREIVLAHLPELVNYHIDDGNFMRYMAPCHQDIAPIAALRCRHKETNKSVFAIWEPEGNRFYFDRGSVFLMLPNDWVKYTQNSRYGIREINGELMLCIDSIN